MDTDALRWFQLVADGLTVTEVSDIYGVSQPGVSRALARLEREVGTPLLMRDGRTLRMTNAGAAFKRSVDPLVHNLDDALAAVSEIVDPESGIVTLAYPLSLGSWLVPRIVRDFRSAHPRVRLNLTRTQVAERGAVSAALRVGRVDLELTAHPVGAQDVEWRRLFQEPLALAVPPSHDLAGAESASLAEVAAEPFVVRRAPSGMRELVVSLCREAGFEPDIAYEADDLPTIRGFVAAGLGVSIVPGQGLKLPTTFARTRVISLSDEGARRDVGLAWMRGRTPLPSAASLRRFILDAAGD